MRAIRVRGRAFGISRADMLPRLARGAIRPVIHQAFSFPQVADAHPVMEADAKFGKLVVEVS